MQRLRLRYAKRGRARFASHRDFGRAFERALRRAGIPMAFSSGFSPHPRISYANAVPTGAASEADYLDIGLAQVRDPAWVRAVLNEALPEGFEILQVAEASGGSLADRLTASRWQVQLPGAEPALVAQAVAALLAEPSHLVTRTTKSGPREFDVRGALLSLVATADGFDLISAMAEPLVRPDDVVSALHDLRPGLGQGQPALLARLEQGTWDGVGILDPLG